MIDRAGLGRFELRLLFSHGSLILLNKRAFHPLDGIENDRRRIYGKDKIPFYLKMI
jgi:hypothetical protein